MSIKGFVTRTVRSLVVTAAAIGLFAGMAVLPANAASAPASASVRPAAVASSVDFAVQCQSGQQFFRLNVKVNSAPLTYAYRLGAFEWTGATWRWIGMVGDFHYDQTSSMNSVQIGGVQSMPMPAGHYWSMVAQVFLWTGSGWTSPVWLYANHSGPDGHYGNSYCRT